MISTAQTPLLLSAVAPDSIELSQDEADGPQMLPQYPDRYIFRETMQDGTPVIVRPIRPKDEDMMVKFHRSLSSDTVHSRYFGMLPLDYRMQHQRLSHVCFIDYDRNMVLVSEKGTSEAGDTEILGIARYNKLDASKDAEFAIVIADHAQHKGLGTLLLLRLIDVARAEKVRRLVGMVLPENTAMLHVCRKLGFQGMHSQVQPVKVELTLAAS